MPFTAPAEAFVLSGDYSTSIGKFSRTSILNKLGLGGPGNTHWDYHISVDGKDVYGYRAHTRSIHSSQL